MSGLRRVTLKGRYSLGLVTTLFCFGAVRGEITITDFVISATYDWKSVAVNNSQSTSRDVDVDYGCAFFSLGIFAIELLDLFLPFGKIAGNLLTHSVASLNGRFENLFSLHDALTGACPA